MRRITTMHTRDVPVDAKAQFKSYCARRGYTMEAAIIALMKKAARDDMPLPDARKKKTTSVEKLDTPFDAAMCEGYSPKG